VFHYGRWVILPTGWAWVPGYTWAPAWVSFRSSDGYIGWSPLGPGETVYDLSPRYAAYNPWVFVEVGYFGARPILPVVVPPHRIGAIYHRCAPISWGWHRGVPVYREVPHVHHVAPAPLSFSSRPNGWGYRNNAVTAYRIDRPHGAFQPPMRREGPGWHGGAPYRYAPPAAVTHGGQPGYSGHAPMRPMPRSAGPAPRPVGNVGGHAGHGGGWGQRR
jgi:hypothetical protein